jgi:gliding motility-associated-like protein
MWYADTSPTGGSEKGEGIAGSQADYDTFGGRYGKGACANGGGGASCHNAGGGGGANAGNIANWQNGFGVPDISNANYITAWNLEGAGTSSIIAEGGGRGGYTFANTNANELSDPPGSTAWGGDNRRDNGGRGGQPLDYTTGKIFMGGGGGAGDGNDGDAGKGGNGAGIVYLLTYGDILGSGNIYANGENGADTYDPSGAPFGSVANIDGSGGGGAGGTIILNTTGNIASTLSLHANGGNGGSQNFAIGLFGSVNEAEGPGGGGGGGYIAVSNGTPSMQVNGGNNGTTDSPYVTNFPPNGATKGHDGIINNNISNNAYDISISDTTICSNSSVTLTVTINGTLPTGTNIEWYDAPYNGSLVGTGTSFTTPTLTNNISYYVKSCDIADYIQVNITVNNCASAPVASFIPSATTICAGDSITFTDNSTGTNITSWNWTFNGGTPASANTQGPHTVAFNTAGTYNVTLQITDANGTDDTTIAITVNPLPNVTANASPSTIICQGNQVTLSGSGASSYSWNNGVVDGVPFTPTITTTYIVTGTDINGCTNTDQLTVTVINCGQPVASFIPSATTICAGDSITFTDNSTGTNITSWNWTFNGGTPASANTQGPHTVAFNTAGTYNVTLQITDANGTDDTTITITVNLLPTVIANATPGLNICLGDSVILVSSGADTYVWDNGVIEGVPFYPTATNTYNVIGTDTNGCSNTDQITITVTNCNLPTASFTVSDTIICAGDSIVFTDNSTGVNISGWNWNFQGGNPATAGTQGPHIIYFNNPGNYNITLLVNDVNGNDDTTISITVIDCTLPNALMNISDTGICQNNCIKINDMSTGGVSSWNWTFNGGTPANSTNKNPGTICWNNPGNYDITLIVSNGYSNDTDTVSITVYPLPILSAGNDTTIFEGNQANLYANGFPSGGNYFWTPTQDIDCPTCDTTFATPVEDITYTVVYTDTNGCSVSKNVSVFVETAIAIGVPNAFSPNGDGNNDVLYVKGRGIESVLFIIYNRYGQKVFETTDITQGWDGTFKGKPENEGIFVYYLEVVFKDFSSQKLKGNITLIR